MNTPVKFELAKLLKEKGFNLKCLKCYLKDGSIQISSGDEGDLEEYNHNQWDNYSAPSIVEVVMWLFETHNIWIYLTREPVTNTFGPMINTETKTISFNNQSIVSRATGQKHDPWENKPENAYQAAIEYVLTEMI